jgi:hypothetical protein
MTDSSGSNVGSNEFLAELRCSVRYFAKTDATGGGQRARCGLTASPTTA